MDPVPTIRPEARQQVADARPALLHGNGGVLSSPATMVPGTAAPFDRIDEA